MYAGSFIDEGAVEDRAKQRRPSAPGRNLQIRSHVSHDVDCSPPRINAIAEREWWSTRALEEAT